MQTAMSLLSLEAETTTVWTFQNKRHFNPGNSETSRWFIAGAKIKYKNNKMQ